MKQKRPANFLYLLIGLLSILIAGPIAYEFTSQTIGFTTQLAFTATLIIGIWSLVDSRRWFIAGIVMATADVIATAFVVMTDSLFAGTITLVVEIAFCSMTLVFTLQHVISGRVVDLNRIIGAICAYLLLGVTLAMVNMLVALYVPGSFNGLSSEPGAAHSLALIYYSFVTLSTLGYGDITPASPLARVLAYLTAVVGQFYIAILIGMLVGLYLSDQQSDKAKA